ncbi:ABC transporter permease subunit [Desulfogranum marinum]|uniref:ABC transporter permease subunit n=1 Tax=Desulfogranum marinum TaxID=453220 RepID=UPI0029C8690D|nr:ABC transporter permease subunit [Desulfogranum marinum]
MNNALQIALLCYKESLHHKLIYGILTISCLLMAFSVLISGLFMRDILKIILDICLAATTIGGLLVPFFLAVNVLAGDIDQKTIYTILAKQVSKPSYIIGKFLGLGMLTATIMGMLTIATLLAVATAYSIYPSAFFVDLSISSILITIIIKSLGILVLNSVVLLWSAVTTSTFLVTLLTLLTYFIGQTVEDVVRFITLNPEGIEFTALMETIAKGSLYIFPNLAAFDFSYQAAYGLPIPIGLIGIAVLYGTAYIAAIISLTTFLFQRRDLP